MCGHYGGKNKFFDGQTVKTKIITNELIKKYGKDQVKCIDTYGGKSKLIHIVLSVLGMLRVCDNIIILPAQNSLRIFAPILAATNRIYKKKLHYIVVGGWLPEFLDKKRILLNSLKKFDYIYVETLNMKEKLEEMGLKRVVVLPNCKELKILTKDELIYSNEEILKLCTFSRVMKEKGIEDAINAVEKVNNKQKRIVFSLDIYGQIDPHQEDWFSRLINNFPQYICYKGIVPFDKSTNVLKHYNALLFPTYYEGEGFAGTLIDAMAAGIPVVASDWRYNSEIVKDGETGLIIKENESLEEKLEWILKNRQNFDGMKERALKEANKYLPQNALKQLFLLLA